MAKFLPAGRDEWVVGLHGWQLADPAGRHGHRARRGAQPPRYRAAAADRRAEFEGGGVDSTKPSLSFVRLDTFKAKLKCFVLLSTFDMVIRKVDRKNR